MLKVDKKVYVLNTYSPGSKITDPGLNPRFQTELAAKAAGKLRDLHKDEPRLNHSPYNFHEFSDWMTPKQVVKDEVIIDKFTVPLKNEDGSENKLGTILLETADDVITKWKSLLCYGDTRIHLDTRFGLDLTVAERAKIFEGQLDLEVPRESDDISKRKMPKHGS